jgi:hypothetical protein
MRFVNVYKEFFYVGNKWYESPIFNVTIDRSNFYSSQALTTVTLHGVFDQINVDSSNFKANVSLHSSTINSSLVLANCTFDQALLLNNVKFNDADVGIKWDAIKDRKLRTISFLTYVDPETGIFIDSASYYNVRNPEDIKSITAYDELILVYQKLLTKYRERGDIESYNGCFAEMKDIQTIRLEYLFRKDKSFNSFFRWQLALLIKFYTNHGTDPAKAIVISIYLVLLFGLFYFFFPSDWDVTSKAKLVSTFKDFIEKNEKGYVRPLLALALGFFISLLNAITLSLNAFTTLGFGNIPTHGIARYICVLEGLIGWFMLSIFTVALINQLG